ncbi:MAG: response regulator [Alphaproteobacteria bacterium]
MIGRLLRGRPKFQIALGLSSIVVSLLLLAAMVGLIPDRTQAIADGHAALAESIAVNSSIFITQSDLKRMRVSLDLVVTRNDDLVAAAVRRKDGEVLVQVDDHKPLPWIEELLHGRLASVSVPIYEGKDEWGEVALTFRIGAPTGWYAFMLSPVALLAAALSVVSFLCFYFYLGIALKQLDPSQAVPDRVRSALDTLAEGLVVLDAKQNIVLANQVFASIAGRSPSELVGHEIQRFSWLTTEDEPLDSKRAPWSETLADGQPRIGSIIRLETPADGRKTFMTNCSPVMAGSRTAGALISFDDISALEEKEIQLRLSKEEAEAANRSKSEFLANMSHEIRTPMNAILGFAEVLKRGYSRDSEQNLRYLNTISSSGKHLLDLINDILDISKIESGHLEVESIDCALHQIINEVVQIMTVKAEEKGIYLRFQPDGPLPENVRTDPRKVRQIVTNLIGNAIKFTEQGGVTVSSRLSGRGAMQTMTISVADTGIGMSPEQSTKVFESFTQADSSITRRFGGTGLGLTISRRFAQALDGDIAVASVQGEGSTFSLTIRVKVADGVRLLSPDEIIAAAPAGVTSERPQWRFPAAEILVVDDGDENRELLEVVLGDLDLRVTTATNGQAALDLATSRSFALVLMDVQMPVMDGYTAVGRMRAYGIDIPVIALTAHAMEGTAERCAEAGYSGYMTKPIDVDGLIEYLARELGGTRLEQSSVPAPSVQQAAAAVPQPLRPAAVADTAPVISSLDVANPRVRAIIEKFVGRLGEQVAALEAACQAGEREEAAKLCHWLKGSAGSVGYHAFTAPASELEAALREQRDDAAAALLSTVRSLAARVVLEAPTTAATRKVEATPIAPASSPEPLPDKLTSNLPDTDPRFRPIIEKFLGRIAERLSDLERCVAVEDFEEVGRLAHWLKGSAGSVGFPMFTVPAQELEQAARHGDGVAVRDLTDMILALGQRIGLSEPEMAETQARQEQMDREPTGEHGIWQNS